MNIQIVTQTEDSPIRLGGSLAGICYMPHDFNTLQNEELTKTFPRGVYYCSSKLIDTENHTIETVVPQDRGLIFVR